MFVTDNKEMEDQLYVWIAQRVRELSGHRSAGIHVTELIYCLTSSYYDRVSPLPITRQASLTMALGIALERTLIPLAMRAPAMVEDGIDYSPDFFYNEDEPSELKTTRMSTKKTIERNFPETWLQQIKCYCYATKQTKYHLAIVHLMGNYRPPFPEIRAVTIEFTQQELDDMWSYIKFRREKYLEAVAAGVPPMPGHFNQDWECENCQYKERCGRK